MMKKNLIWAACLFMVTALVTSCDNKDDDGEDNLVPSNSQQLNQTAYADSQPNIGSVNFTAAAAWTAVANETTPSRAAASWVTLDKYSGGAGAHTLSITLGTNLTGAERKAQIVISAGTDKIEVNITQAAKTADGKDPDPNAGNGPVRQILPLGNGSTAFEIKENMTLTYPNIYDLKGFVYVVSGVTLTVEPGVIIRGDKDSKATLIIERGGKINAQGTKDLPIVFTSSKAPGSRKPGDWGGLILLGNAKNNKGEQTIEGGVRSNHGGLNDNDNSGILSYVRVEFAGIEYSTDNEINGITFGSVGAKTQIDHVQVSHSGDDSFEWFGGVANAKYLVAYSGWDDDFDTDNGFSGRIQYAMAVRNPNVADKSDSNGFESDDNADGFPLEPFTSCIFSNVSLFGPVADPADFTDNGGEAGSTTDAHFQAALHLRRSTQLSIFNSLIAAFPIGLIIENDKGSTTQTWATEGKLNVANCVMAGMIKNFQDKRVWTSGGTIFNNAAGNDDFVSAYFMRSGGGNSEYASLADLQLSGNPLDLTNPIAFPGAGSPLATGAAWSNAKLANTADFTFEQVPYIGAFGPTETSAENWTSGWCEFNPQEAQYW